MTADEARGAKGEMLSNCAEKKRREIDAQMGDRCPIKRNIRGSMSLASWHFPSSVSDTINFSKYLRYSAFCSLFRLLILLLRVIQRFVSKFVRTMRRNILYKCRWVWSFIEKLFRQIFVLTGAVSVLNDLADLIFTSFSNLSRLY